MLMQWYGFQLTYPCWWARIRILTLQTGFEFKNRQASASINGIVVAAEYREAVETVLEGLLDEKNEAEEFKKSIESLKRWRRFLMALRIRERLGILPRDTKPEVEKGVVEDNEVKGHVDMGGGFFAEGGGVDHGDRDSGGFIPEDDNEDGGSFLKEMQSEKCESDIELLEDPEDEDLGWF